MRSASLPICARIVPVRHRLRNDSPASSFLPFVVELFAAGCFARSPSLVLARSLWSPTKELPTPAEVERT